MVSVERFLLPTFLAAADAGYSDDVPTIKCTVALKNNPLTAGPFVFLTPPPPVGTSIMADPLSRY